MNNYIYSLSGQESKIYNNMSQTGKDAIFCSYVIFNSFSKKGFYSKQFELQDFLKVYATYKKLKYVKYVANAIYNSYKIGIKLEVLQECMDDVDKIFEKEMLANSDQHIPIERLETANIYNYNRSNRSDALF